MIRRAIRIDRGATSIIRALVGRIELAAFSWELHGFSDRCSVPLPTWTSLVSTTGILRALSGPLCEALD